MSTINEFLNQQKHLQTQIDAVDLDEIKKSQREEDKESMQADIDVSNAGYDSQINNTQAYYEKQIGDTKISYEDAYQRNAVQKLINEKQIAERNANLGLTDSGLNRTQQTAAQLSYANQKGKIDLARQSALDELNLKLTDAITTLENDKATAVRNITNNWNTYSDEQAQNTYNTKITGLVNQYNSLGERITDMYNAGYQAEQDAIANALNERQMAINEANLKINQEAQRIAELQAGVKRDDKGNIVSVGNTDYPSDDDLTEIKELALAAYDEGGIQAFNKYIDSLPNNIDIEAISDYVEKYGKWYQDWTISKDTKNRNNPFIKGNEDYNDIYSNGTETKTYKELKDEINASGLSQKEKDELLKKLREQSKK